MCLKLVPCLSKERNVDVVVTVKQQALCGCACKSFINKSKVIDNARFYFLSLRSLLYLTLLCYTIPYRGTLDEFHETLLNYAVLSPVTVRKVSRLRSTTNSLVRFAFKASKPGSLVSVSRPRNPSINGKT